MGYARISLMLLSCTVIVSCMQTGNVVIKSEPPGAMIMTGDEQQLGRAPLTINKYATLPAYWAFDGIFTQGQLIAEKNGCEPQSRTVGELTIPDEIIFHLDCATPPNGNAVSPPEPLTSSAGAVGQATAMVSGGAPFLGVALQDVPDGRRSGAMVVRVEPGSPAALGNIQPGDLILTLEGRFVEDARELTEIIRQLPTGSQVELELLRSGQRVPLTVTLGARPTQPGPANTPLMPQDNVTSVVGLGSETVLTADEFAAIKRDNAVAAQARFMAMGILSISGRVHRISESKIVLTGDDDDWIRIECTFPLRPNQREILLSGANRYATPPELMRIHKGDLVTVQGRYETHNMNDVSDCQIVNIMPAAQAPRAQFSAPQMGTAPPESHTPAPFPPPPAGYYQCYRLTVAISANSCKFGDLQLDGQGNYSSTHGSGGTYAFNPAAGVVSFNGGVLNGQITRAKIARGNTYMFSMREGGGLPSPNQQLGIFAFQRTRSGYRE